MKRKLMHGLIQTDNPYLGVIDKKLPIGDKLSTARTILANERTYLAYLRTALTFAIGGFTLIKFFNTFEEQIFGWSFIGAGFITLGIGMYRYIKMRETIKRLELPIDDDD